MTIRQNSIICFVLGVVFGFLVYHSVINDKAKKKPLETQIQYITDTITLIEKQIDTVTVEIEKIKTKIVEVPALAVEPKVDSSLYNDCIRNSTNQAELINKQDTLIKMQSIKIDKLEEKEIKVQELHKIELKEEKRKAFFKGMGIGGALILLLCLL